MKVRKRNGELVQYDRVRIENAIGKALGETDESIEWGKYEEMINEIEGEISDGMSVEDVSDIVESKLMLYKLCSTAKRFIIYRSEHAKRREKGWEMTDLQRDIYEQKYRYNGESFEGFLNRVSGGNTAIKKLMYEKKFIPAGRILANRGLHKDGKKVTLSNCYVMTPPDDNLESIFDTAKKLARTYSYGGGCGVDIFKLRPNNAKVNNNALTTSGSTSFMELYSLTTEIIGQRGRRGALMISISSDHPDLEEFIDIKTDLKKVTKANISIRFTNRFMQAVFNGEKKYKLSFNVEDTGEVIEKIVNPVRLFKKFAENNWRTGEPGNLNWDRITSWHLLSEDDSFEFAGVNP